MRGVSVCFGLGFSVYGIRFRVWGLGCRVWGLGFSPNFGITPIFQGNLCVV